MIKLSNINKYYNKKKSNQIHVINNTSLMLPDRGLIALLGKSGSGKTTLLNVMSGLDRYDSGTISINDMNMEKYDSKVFDTIRSKKIGYIFQNYFLFNDKTVYENLEISLKLAGFKDVSEVNKRIDYALTLVGMLRYKKRRPNTLSGGQQQRIGIARAIVKGSSIIIADEPTGNLDSDNTFEIMDILKSISKTCLVVLVTHEENIANFFADRIIKLKDGEIVEDSINDSNEDLNIINNKAIYLQDLQYKNSSRANNVTINYNGDNKSEIVVNIIEKEGKLYIDALNSAIPVVLVDRASEIKIIDAHYEDKKKGEHVSIFIDKRILSPIEEGKKSNVINSSDAIKKAWKNYRSIPLRRKFMSHLILFGMAILLGVIACMAGTVLFYNEDNYTENKSLISFRDDSSWNSNNDGEIPVEDILAIDGNNYIINEGNVSFTQLLNHSLNNPENSNFNNYYYGTLLYNMKVYPEVLLKDSRLISGTNVINDGEIIIDIHYAKSSLTNLQYYGVDDYNFLIGEYATVSSERYKIVGIVDGGYKGAWITMADYNTVLENITIFKSNENFLYSDDSTGIQEWAEDNGYRFTNLYEQDKALFYSSSIETIMGITITVLISALVMFLIISYNIRASFIARIKEIGTFRCIGVKKSEILKQFIFENIFMQCFSVFIGIIVSIIAMKVVAPILIGMDYSDEYINNNIFLFVGVFVFMFLSNIGMTVFHVYNLLIKTPAEIMAKYDI